MLSRFHLIPERDGRTDGQTDRIAISISRVSVLTRDKNARQRYRHTAQVCCHFDDLNPSNIICVYLVSRTQLVRWRKYVLNIYKML